MDLKDISKYRVPLTVLFLLLCSLAALWIRLIPADGLVSAAGVDLLGNDPWYNLRQVEATIQQFPAYGWYDPMTLFPRGSTIYWGSLFVQIIAFAGVLTGAATRPEIMYVACWIPPLMGTAMVPILYWIGKKAGNTATGLAAAALAAIVSGQYLYRSLFGFVDHHIAEVLFSTLFCGAYIATIVYCKDHPVDFTNRESLFAPVGLAAVTGVAYLLGLFVMPTMILFALIVAVYTGIQFLWDVYHDRPLHDLLLINVTVFAIAAVGMALFGIRHAGIGLSLYSIGHIYAYGAVIGGTVLLYVLAGVMKGRPAWMYPLTLAGLAVVGAGFLMVAAPDAYSVLVGNFISFFGEESVTLTVQEARPWSFDSAWLTFQWGLLLMAAGMAILVWKNIREDHPDQLFVLVWSLVILISTIRHVRYEYYLAVNLTLLSAICIGFAAQMAWPDIAARLAPSPAPAPERRESRKKGGSRSEGAPKKHAAAQGAPVGLLAFAGVLLVTIVFAASSISIDLATAEGAKYSGITPDWEEALLWMADNTPDTGVDYYAIYDRDTFAYPDGAYGVMSWWDYGHWITFVAQRIPNANPFQQGVAGPDGAAAFFVRDSEARASQTLDLLGTRYVVTDIEMDLITSKFWAMATWFDSTRGVSPYQLDLLNPITAEGRYELISLYTAAYYPTMISRLHNFDGSMVEPEEVYYIEYEQSAGASAPIIRDVEILAPDAARDAVLAFNAGASAGSHAGVYGPLPTTPVETVPALQHYRLVHESPTNVMSDGGPDLKYVKVFEYVPGATIAGEGIIEVDVVTDTGRSFTYRQQSINGTFTVPYATTGSPYGVITTGPYRISGTDRTFEVSEEAVMQGARLS
ncbi:MAG: oligosaccharyl transferase, archaeosortase A system-associated [Methanomicrobiales archaeon]|nr:oligosaccharyl transferase, archaeosortase A system-associated [Methanomicrobiales archaeon]